MSSSVSLELAGIDFQPTWGRGGDLDEEIESLQQLVRGDLAATARRPRRAPAASPVFRNALGDEFVMTPTPAGLEMTPWVSGSPRELDEEQPTAGGFLSRAGFDQLRSPAGRFPRKELLQAALRALAELGLIPPGRGGAPAARGASVAEPSAPASAAGNGGDPAAGGSPTAGAAGAGAAAADDGKTSVGDALREQLPGILQQQLVSFLANSWADGTFSLASLGQSVGGALSGLGTAAASAFAMNLLGGKMPDSSSSTAYWAAALLGPTLVGRLLSTGNLKKYMGDGPPKELALREGDADKNGNPILKGCPTVLIEGKPAAREKDPVRAPGTILKFGALKTLIGGPALHAARVKDTESAVDGFEQGACKTQIGGPSTNPNPPLPDKLRKWAQERGLPYDKMRSHTADPSKVMSKEPGYYYSPIDGEWRIWDGEGWSASLSEYENLGDFEAFGVDFGSIFENESGSGTLNTLLQKFGLDWFKERPGNWYLLGGLIDLGSPKFPGAGTGGISWLVPDKIFGLHMGPLYTPHDWRFDPSNPANTLLNVLTVEVESLTGALASTRNPIHWALFVIYILATMTTGLTRWAQSQLQQLDEDWGLPDRYGHRPHSRNERSRNHRPLA